MQLRNVECSLNLCILTAHNKSEKINLYFGILSQSKFYELQFSKTFVKCLIQF